jgi:hypothetical protein
MFHGTHRKTVTSISPKYAVEVPGAAFLTDNRDMAEEYIYPREYGEPVVYDEDGNEIEPGVVVKVILKAENPFIYDMGGRVGDAIEMSRIVNEAKRLGHDSVRFDNVRDGLSGSENLGTSWAVFNASQIKSADPEPVTPPARSSPCRSGSTLRRKAFSTARPQTPTLAAPTTA